ncbi:TrbM/KikA/MpfK family conjugal transfer protein [Propionivibrio sp.]|uniref:TrbM/KikA/MpfK family conjugal transfer protein n=1 Tax=Propionivibrio sp. TaxID=2212460 RepID=UPI0039E59D4D
MKKTVLIAATVAPLIAGHIAPAHADDGVFEGVTRLACEALLCLSSGVRPGACSPSLSYYFDIVKRTMSGTISARLDFLNLCPVASQTSEMQSLVSAISRGAGRCDTASLNRIQYYDQVTGESYVSNQYPAYCNAYYTNSYTDFMSGYYLPKYVGVPERGGYWVDPKDYDAALAEYEARVAYEDEQREMSGSGGGG